MTFSYNDSDLSTSLNRVRRLIGDVSSTAAEFSDEEIDFLVTQESNIFGAASLACGSLAAKYAQRVNKAVGQLKIDLSDKYEHYKELAGNFAAKAKAKGTPVIYAGGISRADKLTQEQDSDRTAPAFGVGMTDFEGTTTSSTNLSRLT